MGWGFNTTRMEYIMAILKTGISIIKGIFYIQKEKFMKVSG